MILLRMGKFWYRMTKQTGPCLITTAVIAATSLPLFYMAIRGIAASSQAWQFLWSERTGQLLSNTLLLCGSVLGVSLCIALPLGWLTAVTDLPCKRLLLVLITAPLAIPTYIGAFAFIAAFGPGGMAIQWAQQLGLDLSPDIYGFPGAVIVLSLYTYPYLLINIRTALVLSDEALKEASHSLGYGAITTFRRITLPILVPAMASGSLLIILYCLSDFGSVSMLRFNTFVRAIYIQYETAFDRSYAAFLGLIVAFLSILLLALERRLAGKTRRLASGWGKRPVRLIRLGVWRWPVFFLTSIIPGLTLGLPIVVTTCWLVRGITLGEPVWKVTRLLGGSFTVAAVGAVTAAGVGLLVAAISVGCSQFLSTRCMDSMIYVGYGLPGIVTALTLVFFTIRFAYPLYQTFTLLIIAYVLRYLPHAVGATKTALLQISPRLQETARSLGASPIRVLLTVVWPLARGGIVGGMALVFLNIVKELPLTLILSPAGFETLATNMWGAVEEAYFARAAAPALLIIFVSVLSLGGLMRKLEQQPQGER